MRQDVFEIVSNRNLAPNVYEMVLRGSSTADCTPGRFVQLKLDSFYLRRPISVCDAEEGKLTLVYKTVGRLPCEMSLRASRYMGGTPAPPPMSSGRSPPLSRS